MPGIRREDQKRTDNGKRKTVRGVRGLSLNLDEDGGVEIVTRDDVSDLLGGGT